MMDDLRRRLKNLGKIKIFSAGFACAFFIMSLVFLFVGDIVGFMLTTVVHVLSGTITLLVNHTQVKMKRINGYTGNR